MSTPRTLDLPGGVTATDVRTPRGTFAAHAVRPDAATAHVLLVPGWTGSKEDFTPLLPLLADAGYAATAYDQRGQFETAGGPDDDYSLAGFAADAAAVAAACSDGPSHLLGHSFGGLVAQTAVLEHPRAWLSLSLLCTGPGALGESTTRPLGRLVQALGSLPLEQIHAIRESAEHVRRPPEIADFLRRRFTSNARASLRAITQHLVDAPDRIDEVATLELPVWVGRGATDDAWPHPVQQQMADRLGTVVHVVDGAAHSPAVEQPERLAEAWLPFLAEAGPR